MPMMDNPQNDYHLSTDYAKLYDLICQGLRIPAWADTATMQDAQGQPYRDICEVVRTGEYEIMMSCRGHSYGNVWPHMASHGSEKDVFIKACQRCNLEWLAVTPDAPAASGLIATQWVDPATGARIERTSNEDEAPVFAIRMHGNCLSHAGHWSLEPSPSQRDQAFLDTHRWTTLESAVAALTRADYSVFSRDNP